MNWKKAALKNFKLYAITDLKHADPGIVSKIDAAYRGGVDIVQLRAKVLTDRTLYRLGLKITAVAKKHRKLFIVNDRPDIAAAVGADGVHLGQDDLPLKVVRGYFCDMFIIGRSTHSLAQALEAEKEGADYIGVGPVFETPTKPTYDPVGLKLIRQAAGSVRIPFVAIGGINAENAEEVLEAGATRIAVVRAVFGEKNPYEAARKLKRILKSREMSLL